MKKLIALASLFALTAWLSAAAQVGLPWPGPGGVVSGGAFTGIGDIVSGAKAHWGMIAYNAATRGSNMLRLCDNAGANCADVASGATTGIVSSTQTIGGNVCTTPGGAHDCFVTTAYDDSGGANCSGGACNLVQATFANMPEFYPNCVGTVPCMRCGNGGATRYLEKASGWGEVDLPATFGGSYSMRIDPGGNVRALASGSILLLGANALHWGFYAGNTVGTTASAVSADTLYAVVGDSDASGVGGISSNGTRTTSSTFGTSSGSTSIALCAAPGGSTVLDGKEMESFVYASQLSTSNITSISTKIRSNGGY